MNDGNTVEAGAMGGDEERELIARAQKGDAEAWSRLVGLYHKRLIGWLRSNPAIPLPGRGKGRVVVTPGAIGKDQWIVRDAEDLAQEIWIKINQKIKQYDPNIGSFFAFLKYWGGLKLLQKYARIGNRVWFESALADLRARFPEIEDEEELIALVNDTPWRQEDDLAPCLTEVFRLAFGSDVPTHQSFAWSHIDVLEWKPKQIAAELSDVKFAELLEQTREEYDARFMPAVGNDTVEKWLEPLQEKVSRVRNHCFSDCYADESKKVPNLTQWAWVVRTHIRGGCDGGLAGLLNRKY